mgnify:CR=1 FL=1|jgi:hypothetical protein
MALELDYEGFIKYNLDDNEALNKYCERAK